MSMIRPPCGSGSLTNWKAKLASTKGWLMISFSDRYRTAGAFRRLSVGDEDFVTTLGRIAGRLRTRVPSGVTVEVEQTGGGVQNIVLVRGETRIYVGDASGNV